ncbi:MAG: hypothetical protein AB1449_06985 [Chloroflexota bacterium]
MVRILTRRWLVLAWLTVALVGCARGNTAPGAIRGYLEALVAGDAVRAINLSCAEWEEQARTEAASFEAVDVSLQDVACAEAGTAGPYALVTCRGRILAIYGGEQQELSLEGRTYRAVQESGDWKMCGYEQ